MRIIKLPKIARAMVFMLFIIGTSPVYSDTGSKEPYVIKLYDSTADYRILKELSDSDFFTDNDIPANYFSEADKNIPGSNDFLLVSAIKKYGGVEYASFSMTLSDSLDRNIKIEWDVPRDNKFLRDKSLGNIITLARKAQRMTMIDAFAETASVSSSIADMSVIYRDDDKSPSAVSGYNFTYNEGFSPTHRFFRTLIELTLLCGSGVANYWINKDDNMEDWRYKYRWEDVGPRFSDGWSFDTNAFRTNTLYHFYSGAIYYQVARSNEYGILASTAWAFGGSLLWEYIGEWREKVSANDMIFTTMGGALMGEAFCQSSIYIEQCMPRSVYGHIFAFLLDPMRFLNRMLDYWLDGSFKVNVVYMNPAAQAVMEIKNNR